MTLGGAFFVRGLSPCRLEYPRREGRGGSQGRLGLSREFCIRGWGGVLERMIHGYGGPAVRLPRASPALTRGGWCAKTIA